MWDWSFPKSSQRHYWWAVWAYERRVLQESWWNIIQCHKGNASTDIWKAVNIMCCQPLLIYGFKIFWCFRSKKNFRYTFEKLSTKFAFISTLTERWPVFLRGEYIMVEFLSSLGEKEPKMTNMHKRASSFLRAVGTLRKTNREASSCRISEMKS